MGKTYSIDKTSGEIAIQIEQLRYFPGDQVNGWVFLKLVKPFPATDMLLILKGKEKAKFTTVTHSFPHKWKASTRTRSQGEKRVFCLQLHNFQS
jgi:hypothetical protein